jgi:glycine dehydrogenase
VTTSDNSPLKYKLDSFVNRHIGPDGHEAAEMLKVIGAESLDALIDETIPAKIRLKDKLKTGDALTEQGLLRFFKSIAGTNKIFKSYICCGNYGTFTPAVILLNIMENPGWYTQNTQYQAEISQGRLEAL